MPGEPLAVDALANALGPVVPRRAATGPRRRRDERRRRQRRRAAPRRAGRRRRHAPALAWTPPGPTPSARAALPTPSSRARETCHALGLPHVTLDLREEFRRAVVDPFVDGYAAGETPNPVHALQRRVPLRRAASRSPTRAGADALWTGHYARIVERDGMRLVARAADPAKDQSYMLATVDPALLERVGFPLGEQTKEETRAEAAAAGLAAAAARREPGGLLPRRRRLPRVPRAPGRSRRRRGRSSTRTGRVLGSPRRATGGSRRASAAGSASPRREPLYVLRTDAAHEHRRRRPARARSRARRVEARGRLHVPVERAEAKLRYRSAPVPASRRRATDGRLRARARRAGDGVARGQVAVLYDDDAVVGAGVITDAPSGATRIPRDDRARLDRRRRPRLRARGLLRRARRRARLHARPLGRHVRAALVVHQGHRARRCCPSSSRPAGPSIASTTSSTSSTPSPTARSSMADSADTAVRAVSTAITTPVKKVTGFAAGVSHGFSAFRARSDVGEAMHVGEGAAAARALEERARRGARATRRPQRRSPEPTSRRPPACGRRTLPRRARDRRGRSLESIAMRTTAELREGFLSFFEEKGHLRCPSASLVPRAGRPLDAPHDGRACSRSDAVLPRARAAARAALTTRRRSASADGKDIDIDEVGLDGAPPRRSSRCSATSRSASTSRTARSSSRGSSSREHMQLDWDRLWVTVHAGDPELGLGQDEVAIELWQQIGMPRERIVPLPRSENFWSGRRTGPVRPGLRALLRLGRRARLRRARLRARLRRAATASSSSGTSSSWSTSSHADGTLTPLPKQNIDTGLGLERGARDPPGRRLGLRDGRLPADHGLDRGGVRRRATATRRRRRRRTACSPTTAAAMTFLVADGVTPSNEGRGYVLRRIIRRAVVSRRSGSGSTTSTGCRASSSSRWAAATRSCVEHADEIERVVRAEEERFRETLERGPASSSRSSPAGDDLRRATRSRSPRRTASRSSSRVELARGARPGGRRRRLPRARWSGTARSRARAAATRARSARPTSRAPPASRPSSSATRRPTS